MAHAASTTESRAQLLQHADDIKTASHPEFVKLLAQLDADVTDMPAAEQWHVRYLDAWQAAFDGNYSRANASLRTIAEQAPDLALRLRATGTMVNILGFGHRYEEGFIQLNQLAELLPKVNDNDARYAAMADAAQFLIIAHQFDQASEYAEQMLQSVPAGKNGCRAVYLKLHAQFHGGNAQLTRSQFQQGVDVCMAGGESLVADAMRSDMATFDIQKGHAAEAIRLLEGHYADVQSYSYPALMQYFNVLLARAYFGQGDLAKARKFALATIEGTVQNEISEPLSQAYQLLYQIENRQGHATEALGFHEKFMAADKGYLNDISAGALAFQTVKQQLLAKKIQLDGLSRQNQILQLQRELDHKAVETSRLYIALLLTVMASGVFWLFRIKRSQLRFKRLATRDSLTNICSRQHYVDETELLLRHAAKTTHSACLILMDLDHFKQVNDTYGHVTGDLVLKRAVAACQHHLRRTDVFGRLGGEEFAILMPECSAATAIERAERIREAIAATPLWGDTRHVIVTASFGIACTEGSGYELRQLMIDADNALYRAKRNGRNRVVYANAPAASTTVTAPAHKIEPETVIAPGPAH